MPRTAKTNTPQPKPTLTATQQAELRRQADAQFMFGGANYEDAQRTANAYVACSARRRLVAWALSIIAGVGTAYASGTLLGYVVVAASVLSGSAFFGMIIYVIGLVLSIYSSLRAFSATFAYVVSDDCTRHIIAFNDFLRRATSFVRFNTVEV